jgi:hypothetical protein
MEKFTQLFEEFIVKAIVCTEEAMRYDLDRGKDIEAFTANRERLFLVIELIAKQVDWEEVSVEKRDELTRQVEYIKKLDEQLLVKLQLYRETLKCEIETTVRHKDSIKGYNLSDVK